MNCNLMGLKNMSKLNEHDQYGTTNRMNAMGSAGRSRNDDSLGHLGSFVVKVANSNQTQTQDFSYLTDFIVTPLCCISGELDQCCFNVSQSC